MKQIQVCPPVLKVDSDATVEIGIANTSWAIWEMTRYLEDFIFHHIKMSKSSTLGSSKDSNQRYSIRSVPAKTAGISHIGTQSRTVIPLIPP